MQIDYTGHEHLNYFGFINMNGRMYGYSSGRMFSPDNYVQAPDFTQSYNRYTYCWNNPLKYTDPSGEFMLWDDLIVGGVGFSLGYVSHGLSTGDWGKGAVKAGAIGAGVALLGYYTGGGSLAGGTIGGGATFAGNYAINSAISTIMPSYNMKVGDFNFSMGLNANGINGSVIYSDGDWTLGVGGGIGGAKTGSGYAMTENRLSFYAGKNLGDGWNIGFSRNYFGGNVQQVTGNLTVGYRDFIASYENDHFAGWGDGGDRWRTAAWSVNYNGEYGSYGVGANMYTNDAGPDRGEYVNKKLGYDPGIYAPPAHGLSGGAYVRAGSYRYGSNNPKIAAVFQNGAHSIIGLPHWNWNTGREISGPFMIYKTYNIFTNW